MFAAEHYVWGLLGCLARVQSLVLPTTPRVELESGCWAGQDCCCAVARRGNSQTSPRASWSRPRRIDTFRPRNPLLKPAREVEHERQNFNAHSTAHRVRGSPGVAGSPHPQLQKDWREDHEYMRELGSA
jgi:hypothetical protein